MHGRQAGAAAAVVAFTAGVVPPRFHSCHVRYYPEKNLLQLEVDMNFQSSGFQCIVRPPPPLGPIDVPSPPLRTHNAVPW